MRARTVWLRRTAPSKLLQGDSAPGARCRLRQRQIPRRFPEQVARHRLDPVVAGGNVDPVQIQLEDLLLRELALEQQRDPRFAHFAPPRALVAQEQGPRELLRERAASFHHAPADDVAHDGTPEREGIDPRVAIKPVVLNRHNGVLQVRRNPRDRHISAFLVHPEPGLPISIVERQIADAARQLVDRPPVAQDPRHRHEAENREHHEQDRADTALCLARDHPRRRCKRKESTR
jgi:hypothetical protein